MNEFKRKQWTRIGLSLIAVIVAVLFLTGAVGGKPMTYRIGENDQELTAAEQGFGGEVTAHVVLNGDNTVKSLSVDTPDETAGLGQRASETEFTDQFIGKAGPFAYGENGIEALSGATVTSGAALKAINRAITGEEAEAAAEEQPEEEKPAEEQSAEEKTAEEQPAGESAEASEQGFGGEVTVHLALNDDRTVQSLTIDTPNETAGLGQRASEAEFTDQFIGKAGPFSYGENGVEAISGATVTSNAVLTAINKLAGGESAAEEKPAEEQSAEGEPAEEQPAEEQPAEMPAKTEEANASAGQVYGSYLSEKETNFSTIRVAISTKNDQITDCTITSEAKSEGSDFLTDEIRTAWAKAIVENQTAETDAITGATLQFSAGAVKEAVAEIQQQMSGEPAAETPAEEQPGEEKPAEEQPAETPAKTGESNASAGQVYGTYLSEKETNFSTIRVTISTKNDEITDCTITSEAKSEGSDFLTDEIRTAWAKAIVENQTAETDAITGATLQFSAGAVKEAVGEIQQLIAGETPAAAEEPAEEKPAEEAAETPTEEPAAEQPEEETKPAEEQPAAVPAEEPAAEEPADEKPEEPEQAPAEEPAKAEEASAPAPYGGYTAAKETPFSTIRVIVSTRNGVITDCRIRCDAKEGQTDLVTDENEETWAKAVVASQGTELDTVSGATVSTDAVREAVAEILEKIR